MIRRAALRETVTVFVTSEAEDEPLTDRYGNPLVVEDDGTDVPAAVQPTSRTTGGDAELEIDRDTRIGHYTVLVPPDTNLDGLSEVEWRGLRYTVVGEPQVFTARGGSEAHHLEFRIRRIEG